MKTPHVVYHIAAMGNWEDVIKEQFFKLRTSGLAKALKSINDHVAISFNGSTIQYGIVLQEAERQGVPILLKHMKDLLDYEKYAMLYVQELAATKTDRSILYFHTKGVSVPDSYHKKLWRKVMTQFVITNWAFNTGILTSEDYNCIGWNWRKRSKWNKEQHFSGNFWMATPEYIRTLPDFETYYKNRVSCELWIGSNSETCKPCSLGVTEADPSESNQSLKSFITPRSKKLTWISACTHNYMDDMARLVTSSRHLSEEHEFIFKVVPDDYKDWRHEKKLWLFEDLLSEVRTEYVAWIDADCEFICPIQASDIIDPTKEFFALRHFYIGSAFDFIPGDLLPMLPKDCEGYWQACLWGGQVEAVKELINCVRWVSRHPIGYDEHAINIYLQNNRDKVHTLPCRYGFPKTLVTKHNFSKSYYDSKYEGLPIINHYASESSKKLLK
jgi:hypothetical protein